MIGLVTGQDGQIEIDVILDGHTVTQPNMVYSPRADTVIYTGDHIGVDLEWDTGNTLDRVDIYNCQGEFVTSWTEEFGGASSPFEDQLEFREPYDSQCSLGRDTYTVEADFSATGMYGEEEFYLNTVPKRGIQSIQGDDYGRKMVINLRPTDGGPQLRAFQFTNDFEITQKSAFSGNFNEVDIYAQKKGVILNPFNNDEQNSFKAKPGTIVSPTESVDPLLQNSCSGPVCDKVIKQDFTTDGAAGDAAVWSDLSSIYPVHRNDDYRPIGEIAFAYHPKHANLPNVNLDGDEYDPLPNFFVCTDTNEMVNSNGDNVPRVINLDKDYQDLYKCNTETNEWEPTNECDDGLDNDGDGNIDASNDFEGVPTDPSCETSNDESAVGSEVCYPGEETPCVPEFTCEDSPLATQHPNGTTYAYYDTGDGCEFTKWSEWEVTTTLSDGSLAISNPDEFSCSYSETSTNEDCPPESQWSEDWENDGSMPVTEYGALPNHFRNLADAKNRDLTTQGVSSQFVEQNNGWVSQTQGLHTAERRYDIDQIGGQTGSINEGNCGSGFISYSGDDVEVDCESWEWWDSRNLSDAELNYETSSDVTDRKGSWRPANAGTTSGVRDETGDEDYVFKGGWAGECGPDGFWTVMDDDRAWACDSSTPVSTSFGGGGGGGGGGCCDEGIEIPKFGTSAYLPDTEKYTENDVEKREIGMIQFPYINQAGDTPEYIPSDVYSYRNLVGDVNGDGDPDEITQLRAECWTGGLSDKPDDIDNSERAFHTTTSPRQDDVWGVSQVVETGGLNGYACYWGYETAERSEIVLGDSEESVVHLHRNQEPGTDYYGFWEGVSSESEYGLQESYDKGELSQELN